MGQPVEVEGAGLSQERHIHEGKVLVQRWEGAHGLRDRLHIRRGGLTQANLALHSHSGMLHSVPEATTKLKRAALIPGGLVKVGGGYGRGDGLQCFWCFPGRQPLGEAKVGRTNHADLAARPGLASSPGDGIGSISRLHKHRGELALRSEAPRLSWMTMA